MKKLILNFAFILLAMSAVFAQNDKFNAAMKTAVITLNTAQKPDDFIAVANTFTRIGAAESKEWLPGYYAAYAYLIAGFQTSDADMTKAQQYIDNAQTLLTNAAKLAAQPADISEISVLQAYIYIGKVTENPMVKGGELSPKVFQELGKAASLNPNNPRAPFIQGMFTLNMPEFYGGGAKNAKPLFEKAKELYEKETSDGIRPDWGEGMNEGMLKS